MKVVSLLSLAALLPARTYCLAGFGFLYYRPLCAHGCGRVFWSNLLTCSMDPNAPMPHDMTDNTMMTESWCLAKDTSYLISLAYCISKKCDTDVLPSEIEIFWEKEVTQDKKNPPKWSYGQALAQVSTPPTRVLGSQDILNYTALWNDTVWKAQVATLRSVSHESELESYVGSVFPHHLPLSRLPC
jgi:hypothetical protein